MSAVGGTRTTFGKQTTSRRKSAPSYGFGSGTRAGQEKVFVSHEHSKLQVGSVVTPGPQYNLKSAVGEQVSSPAKSAPKWAFGTAQRFNFNSKPGNAPPGPGQYTNRSAVGTQVSSAMTSSPIFGFGSSTREHQAKVFVSQEHAKLQGSSDAPGPEYNLISAVGKQVHSKTVEQPAWVMGKSERFGYDHVKRAAGAPGPGTYVQTPAVGPQVASTKPSTPRFGFGTSNRDHQAKVYLSPEHEKTTAGREAPGPGTYTLTPSTGNKQPQSNLHSAAAWGFGTASRFTAVKGTATGPGPGSYVV